MSRSLQEKDIVNIDNIISEGKIEYQEKNYPLAEEKFRYASELSCNLPINIQNLERKNKINIYWAKSLSAQGKTNSSEFIGLVKTIKKNDDHNFELFFIKLGRFGNRFHDWLEDLFPDP